MSGHGRDGEVEFKDNDGMAGEKLDMEAVWKVRDDFFPKT